MAPVSIRPMEVRDIPRVQAVAAAAFEDLSARTGEPPEPPRDPAERAVRYRHLLATDPGGAWVAESAGAVVGCAVAVLREGVWGLSLLVVSPGLQGAGVGSGLLARARAHGEGARGSIVLASRDHRALRAYVGLGLDLHPAAHARGHARGVRPPEGLRAARPEDRPWLDAVGRHVRGAAHGDDLDAMARGGAGVTVLPERGYAVWGSGPLQLLAARDEDAAATLLRAYLAAAGDHEAAVESLTARQGWAIRECVAAGLRLDTAGGAVLTGGEVGPMAPYLPSGAYL
jgi:GNAT superfamily N-acetyltransferase